MQISPRTTRHYNILTSQLSLKPEFAAISSIDVTQVPQQQSTLVEAFNKSLEQGNYDKLADETLVLHTVPETSNGLSAKHNVEYVLTTLKVAETSIKQRKGLGSPNTDNARLRPLELVLSSVFDRRTALANALLLKGSGIFAKKLSRKDRLKEILKVRYELVQRGLYRNLFRIRD